ncbi:dehydrogenase/reductase [Xylariaceae sp. FL0255]|nr:dehydrogenase/reductase [Xylariaceae sp. FL0255]
MNFENTLLITGGTAGLGYEAALSIARAKPKSLVVLSSRSDKNHAADSINKTLGQKNTIYIPLDLADQKNVRAYAKEWSTRGYPPIQALLLNAGLQFPGELTRTVDGLEATFGINHIGNALLFHLLCPYLANNARIISTASGTHDPAQISGLPDAEYTTAEELAHPTSKTINYSGRQRCATSKLCNILWIYSLDRHLKKQASERSITATAFDPGLMPGSGLAREAGPVLRFFWTRIMPHMIPLMKKILSPNIHTMKESGESLAGVAIDPELQGVSGEYFEGRKPIKSSIDSYDEAKQEDLWQWTINYLAQGEEEREKFEQLR